MQSGCIPSDEKQIFGTIFAEVRFSLAPRSDGRYG